MTTPQKQPTAPAEDALACDVPAVTGTTLLNEVVEDDLPLSDCGPETALCW